MDGKLNLSKKFLSKNCNLLECPHCSKNLYLKDNSLICESNHTFDLSKKGTINLLRTKHYKDSPIYTTFLFQNRREFIAKDYYNNLYDLIASMINKKFKTEEAINILDLGCGEGSHAQKILNRLKIKYQYIGFDYSKNAISEASDFTQDNQFYFVGDVNSIPIKSKKIDVILDILSPHNEKEVKRLLKKNGLFIKISPGEEYLKELRFSVGLDLYKNKEEIENNLNKQFHNMKKREIIDKYLLENNDFYHLLNMTPINDKKIYKTCKEITINLIIYTVGD